MNRALLLRWLRITWTAFFGITCLVLAILWVRSYWTCNTLSGGSIEFSSARGVAQFSKLPSPTYSIWQWEGLFITDSFPTLPAFQWHSDPGLKYLNLPYWFLVLIAAASAAAPWLSWSKRLSLRALLIAMTLLAVVLGAVVYRTAAPAAPPKSVGDFGQPDYQLIR